MLTDADRRRLLKARTTAAQARRETEIPLGKWRDTPMGALGEELSVLLQRLLEQQAGVLPRLAQYDFHSVKDPTGARAVVALMLAAAIVKVGPNIVGECFAAAATHEWRPDLRALMRELVNAYGYEEVREAVGHAGQRGELPTDSATLVYIWTEVSVRGEIDPLTYNHRPGIELSDVFTTMAGRKWFLDRNGKAFRAPRATLER